MKFDIVIQPVAEDDLKETFAWYEDKRIGLGHDFLLQFEAGINFLERNPLTHPVEYKGTRKHFIKRFPYKIIYLVRDNKVFVLGVLHGKRSFDLLKQRADNA